MDSAARARRGLRPTAVRVVVLEVEMDELRRSGLVRRPREAGVAGVSWLAAGPVQLPPAWRGRSPFGAGAVAEAATALGAPAPVGAAVKSRAVAQAAGVTPAALPAPAEEGKEHGARERTPRAAQGWKARAAAGARGCALALAEPGAGRAPEARAPVLERSPLSRPRRSALRAGSVLAAEWPTIAARDARVWVAARPAGVAQQAAAVGAAGSRARRWRPRPGSA